MADVFGEIKLYDDILPVAIKERLDAIRNLRTESNWEVGRIALDATEHLKSEQGKGRFEGVHMYHIWHALSHRVQISPLRIQKLARIFEAFPEAIRNQYSKYDFGYFEKSYDFPVKYRYEALEFLDFFEGEHGRMLRVTEFKYLFRKHIMGERPDAVLDLPEAPEYASLVGDTLVGDILQPSFNDPLTQLQRIISSVQRFVRAAGLSADVLAEVTVSLDDLSTAIGKAQREIENKNARAN